MIKANKKKFIQCGQLRERHLEILKFAFEYSFITRPILEDYMRLYHQCHKPDSRYVLSKRLLASLVSHRLLEIVRYPHDHKNYYNVSSKGIPFLKRFGQINEHAQYSKIDEATIQHETHIMELRFILDQMEIFHPWMTTRTLLLTHDTLEKIPDLHTSAVFRQTNERVLLGMEMELTRKNNARYLKIFDAYNHSDYDYIFYFVTTTSLRDLILKLSKRICDKIYVCTLQDLLSDPLETCLTSNQETISFKRLQEAFSQATKPNTAIMLPFKK